MIKIARVTIEGHVTRRPELVFVGLDITAVIVQKVIIIKKRGLNKFNDSLIQLNSQLRSLKKNMNFKQYISDLRLRIALRKAGNGGD